MSFILCASPLRRQAVFAALAALTREGPHRVAARLRPLAPPDSNLSLSPQGRIGRALMITCRAREIVRAAFGGVPDGLLGALHRIGDGPLPAPDLYGLLHETFACPEHRQRARVLRQVKGALTATTIRLVHRLDPVLLHPRVVERVHQTEQADVLNAALSLVRATVSSASDASLRLSIESLHPEADLADFFSRWLAKMDRPPALPPIPAGDPDFAVVTTGQAMAALGRRYGNCAAQQVPFVAAGARAYIEWRHPPGAIAECWRTSEGQFILVEIHAQKNRPPPAGLAAEIRRKLAAHDIPAISPGEGCPRVRDVLHLLRMWDLGADLGFDQSGQGLLSSELDLGDVVDAA